MTCLVCRVWAVRGGAHQQSRAIRVSAVSRAPEPVAVFNIALLLRTVRTTCTGHWTSGFFSSRFPRPPNHGRDVRRPPVHQETDLEDLARKPDCRAGAAEPDHDGEPHLPRGRR